MLAEGGKAVTAGGCGVICGVMGMFWNWAEGWQHNDVNVLHATGRSL